MTWFCPIVQCLPAHVFDELRSDFHVTSHRHASAFDADVSFVRAAFSAIDDVAKIVPKVESFCHAIEFTGAAGTVIGRPTAHHLWDVGMEMAFCLNSVISKSLIHFLISFLL